MGPLVVIDIVIANAAAAGINGSANAHSNSIFTLTLKKHRQELGIKYKCVTLLIAIPGIASHSKL